MKKKIIRSGLRALLVLAYLFLSLYGFLAGMFSESLIGSTHPWAGALAKVLVWFGVVVGVSPVFCLISANVLRDRPVARCIVLALPFILLAVQLALGCIADSL